MYKKYKKWSLMGNLPLFLDGTLNFNNRWVVLASLIPWSAVEELYSKNFTSHRGPKALPARVALGALIIQTKLNLSDSETVYQITENPYSQYFIGFDQYTIEAPFYSSIMTYFRKGLNLSDIKEIDSLLNKACQKTELMIDILWKTRTNKENKIKP